MRNRRLAWWGLLMAALAGCSRPGSSSPQPGAVPAAAAPTRESPIRLVDVAPQAGIRFSAGHQGKTPLNILDTMGGGAAFLDFDADGWLDAFLVAHYGYKLYRNRGDGTFEDATDCIQVKKKVLWQGCSSGDYDNDGYPDLVVTGYGDLVLLHNQKGERFQDVTDTAGIQNQQWTTSAAFVDMDRDGRLDLYVGAYVEFGPNEIQLCPSNGIPAACGPRFYDPHFGRMYRNLGNGRFKDVTQEWGFDVASGKALGVSVGDYDNDGWTDLYVSNDVMACDMYHNLGGGKVENVALLAGTAYAGDGGYQSGMGTDWGDYDNDGRLDLVVCTFHREPVSLYHNEGEGIFSEVSNGTGLAQTTLPWVTFSTRFFDVDSDGWLDLFFTNGHVQDNVVSIEATQSYHQASILMRNRGDGTFEDVSAAAGPDVIRKIVGRAAAFGDYDNDGDLDILVCDLDGPALLLQNQSQTGHHWLMLQLQGTKSNCQGLGARITATIGGQQRLQEARTAGSFMAGNDPRVHLGLGEVDRVERLQVRWPSGTQTVLTDVRADQFLLLKEGQSVAEVIRYSPREVEG